MIFTDGALRLLQHWMSSRRQSRRCKRSQQTSNSWYDVIYAALFQFTSLHLLQISQQLPWGLLRPSHLYPMQYAHSQETCWCSLGHLPMTHQNPVRVIRTSWNVYSKHCQELWLLLVCLMQSQGVTCARYTCYWNMTVPHWHNFRCSMLFWVNWMC